MTSKINAQIEKAQLLLGSHGWIVVEPGYFDTMLQIGPGDLDSLGFDTTNVTDEQMQEIAEELAQNHTLIEAWKWAIQAKATSLNIPRLEKKK